MIDAITRFFEQRLNKKESEADSERACRLQLATAALMFELLKTDQIIDERETAALRDILRTKFQLDDERLEEIITLAEAEARQSVSLYEFTSLVNQHYGYDDRVQLIENLWHVALADQHLDKYEEQMIRRTADLLHVSHSDFIRTKLKVRDQSSPGGAA